MTDREGYFPPEIGEKMIAEDDKNREIPLLR